MSVFFFFFCFLCAAADGDTGRLWRIRRRELDAALAMEDRQMNGSRRGRWMDIRISWLITSVAAPSVLYKAIGKGGGGWWCIVGNMTLCAARVLAQKALESTWGSVWGGFSQVDSPLDRLEFFFFFAIEEATGGAGKTAAWSRLENRETTRRRERLAPHMVQ